MTGKNWDNTVPSFDGLSGQPVRPMAGPMFPRRVQCDFPPPGHHFSTIPPCSHGMPLPHQLPPGSYGNREWPCVPAEVPPGPRERKYAQKIYVDGLFPAHVRPASVLIGTKGMNHNRMQASGRRCHCDAARHGDVSGCTVQLRGKGCSQPSSQWPDEPVHLLVKYDTEEQEILKEIVDGYESQNPRRSGRPPPSIRPPPRPFLPSASPPFFIPGWYPENLTEAQLNAEVELLWLFRVYFVKEHASCLDDLGSRLASFFCIDSIMPHLSRTSIPASSFQLRDFIVSCPHFLLITPPSPGAVLTLDSNVALWDKVTVSLVPTMETILKDSLKDLHRAARREQAEQLAARRPRDLPGALFSGVEQQQEHFAQEPSQQDHQQQQQQQAQGSGSSSGHGRDDLPQTCLCLLLQALHFLISETNGTSFIHLEDRFLQRFDLPLCASAFGYSSVVALVKDFPSIFSVQGVGREMRVEALPNPDFSVVEIFVQKQPCSAAAAAVAARNRYAANHVWPSPSSSSTVEPQPATSAPPQELAAPLKLLMAARPSLSTVLAPQRPQAEETNTPAKGEGASSSSSGLNSNSGTSANSAPLTMAQTAPRLLGLLGKLVGK